MQREAGAQSGLTVVDEFEYGLEPHRIMRLLRVLRGRKPEGNGKAKGQLILTTHSTTVLCELDAEEVAITRRGPDGTVTVNSLPAAVGYVLKRAPQAFVQQLADPRAFSLLGLQQLRRELLELGHILGLACSQSPRC
jgi:hypothetical protein